MYIVYTKVVSVVLIVNLVIIINNMYLYQLKLQEHWCVCIVVTLYIIIEGNTYYESIIAYTYSFKYYYGLSTWLLNLIK